MNVLEVMHAHTYILRPVERTKICQVHVDSENLDWFFWNVSISNCHLRDATHESWIVFMGFWGPHLVLWAQAKSKKKHHWTTIICHLLGATASTLSEKSVAFCWFNFLVDQLIPQSRFWSLYLTICKHNHIHIIYVHIRIKIHTSGQIINISPT